MKFMHIVCNLQNLGDIMDEKEVVRQFMRAATPSKFDALTLSLVVICPKYGMQCVVVLLVRLNQ